MESESGMGREKKLATSDVLKRSTGDQAECVCERESRGSLGGSNGREKLPPGNWGDLDC